MFHKQPQHGVDSASVLNWAQTNLYPEQQREFVKNIGTPDVAILNGPPGSGKTTAICELILQLISKGQRVLLCASTHVAVDNVIERLMDEQQQRRDEVIPIRIGDRKNVSEFAGQWHLERLMQTERRRLLTFLRNQKRRSKAQQTMFSALQSKERQLIETLLLESERLVSSKIKKRKQDMTSFNC